MATPMLLRRGAEAEVVRGEWQHRPAVFKTRLPKTYRHPSLDQALRVSRMKTEARLLSEARHLGIPVPPMYDLDLHEATMTLAYLEGPTLAEFIRSGAPEANDMCRALGTYLGRLHRAKVVHGDLTTSNMIVQGSRLHLLDFSLGGRGADLEAMGVDLHLMRESFNSAHPGREELWSAFFEGYGEANPGAEEVLAKVKAIEARGRYRGS